MMVGGDNVDSSNILKLINPGTVGAEVGVWKGSTSKKLLRKDLKKLYMIDPWSTSGYDPALNAITDDTFDYVNGYLTKYSKIAGGNSPAHFNKYYDSIHAGVVKEFTNPEAEICRMTLEVWAKKYSDVKLDWIYVDGDHSYTGVMNDLNLSIKVLKEDGLILGDDYTWGKEQVTKIGVNRAVNEFVKKNNFKLVQHGSKQFQIIR